MRMHVLQHAPFEDAAHIATWAQRKGYQLSTTALYADEPLPSLDAFDWLTIMGGPMNVYEEERYPWLACEKALVKAAAVAGKIVLGVCLGAQLIADVLGGAVYPNPYQEIGWHPVTLAPQATDSRAFRGFPENFTPFHWHGDTVLLTTSFLHTAWSVGCRNQAFECCQGRVVGLQFHLESTAESIARLIAHCGEEIIDGKYIQRADAMLPQAARLAEIQRLLEMLLENLATLAVAQQPAGV